MGSTITTSSDSGALETATETTVECEGEVAVEVGGIGETAGELGALLLEARLIKELAPIHNRRLRRTRDLFTICLQPGRGGASRARVMALNCEDGNGQDALYGAFRTKRQAEAALNKVRSRKTKVQSWFLDLNLVMGYWGEGAKRAYHHTAPVNALYALHESLVMLREEGLENSWKRHAHNHQALKAGFEAMGISFLVEESARLPQLNSVMVPAGVDEAAVRSRLLNEFNLEIGAGLGDLALVQGAVTEIRQANPAVAPVLVRKPDAGTQRHVGADDAVALQDDAAGVAVGVPTGQPDLAVADWATARRSEERFSRNAETGV